MNVKFRVLSAGVLFFIGQGAMAQKAKKDTTATKEIEEVVVVAYGKQKKNSVVGSNLQIKSEKLAERPISDVSQALDGAGPGIQVSASTGQPGEGLSVRIRGISSYSYSNNPLYVLDGAIYNGPLSAINPADIESINVLKDAAATSLYGSSAANGVVLLTTKKGKKGKDRIDFSATTGISARSVPEYDRVNAAQYYPLTWEALRNGRLSSGIDAANSYATNNLINVLKTNVYNVPDNQLVVNGILNPNAKLRYDDFDWARPLIGTGIRNEYNLGLSGGTEKTTYRTSLGYTKEDGYLKTTDFERFTLRVAVDSQVKSWLKLGANLSAAAITRNNGVDGAASSASYVNPYRWTRVMGPIYSPYIIDPVTGQRVIDPVTGQEMFDPGDKRGTDAAAGRNVIAETLWNRNFTRDYNVNSILYAEVAIDPYLKFTTNVAYSYQNTFRKTYTNKLIGDAAGLGSAERYTNFYQTLNWNQKLSYTRKFGDHSLDAFFAHENYRYSYDYLYAYKTGQTVDNNDEMINFVTPKNTNGYYNIYTKESWFGNLSYGYQGKYHLQGSIRWDASSRFAKDVRWNAFWSVGGNWVVSNESFLKGNSVVNYLKLMASYGQVGNDALNGYYPYQTLYSIGYPNVTEGGILFNQLSDPKLTWESNNQTDVSLEFGLFKSRITGSAGWYRRYTKDMLFRVPVPVSAGVPDDGVARNVGDMQNTGWEFQLSADIIKNQNFKWNVNINASTYKNVLKKLIPGQSEIINGTKRIVEGKSIYDYWLRQWYGVDPKDGAPLFVADPQFVNPNALSPDIRMIDGQALTTTHTKAKYDWSGSAIPDWYGSFGSNFKYKNWDLSVMFTYQIGGKIYDSNYAGLMSGYPQGGALSTDILNRWTTPGQITDTPAMNTATYNTAGQQSSRWLVSASYIQLRNATFGYTFNKESLKDLGVDNLRLYVSGENIWAKTARKGLEPGGGGFNGTVAPRYTPARIVSLGLNVSF
ncbi:SusC/RagA family TonB-linked outer membrane protein [Elizabethkingia miricola]|uniref:SusC/RagA family TonB-linked outer membrane protein n=1 Tax=Elizabethkingia miricola TaxID=172045 RepID=A0AAP1G3H6_ELIMR|nr:MULTISPECIES: SusC/RagA family TonB-linked outer membrane protein [Elizabethkingia]KUY15546.1 SusC/RagA family TonB-linked outer membrane protein [Elizabethkingia miricola]MCL1651947.1 SusC/RagA family TonB-linked outer membrane protein [Elizabethkingia miricola]MCL1679475.1 SusC/RagA family TonB-linked outer membrane protein [Elizabethkingia miricola]OPC07877.1 SusC/RagA family TonB-linked outer membrane protein [Elizabethkingia miricola]OPC40665.1 SusC/RagA family TonB-linked outer membra